MLKSKIQVGIVDDHKLFRDGMILLLNNYKELCITCVAANGIEFFNELVINKCQINVLLLDVEMPVMDGIEVLKKIKVVNPEIKPLIISSHEEGELIYELVELGAKGFLQKSADIEEVLEAIKTVSKNELYLNKDVSIRIIGRLVKKAYIKKIEVSPALSNREKEIIKLICSELTVKEIAHRLHISERTIDTHKASIFEKTKTKNSAGIVMYAMRTGIVE